MRIVLTLVALLSLCLTNANAQDITFRDATIESGIPDITAAAGVSVFDYDQDGWDDLLITSSNGPVKLFRNNSDGSFDDATLTAGISYTGNYCTAIFADLNNDGTTDLFLGGRSSTPSRILLGADDNTFSLAPDVGGIDSLLEVGSAAIGDYDGDGFLDIFVATRNATDILYRNTGEDVLAFEDVSVDAAILGNELSVAMQSTWIDYDMDGDLDLFSVHDGSKYENRLYHNSGAGPMVDVATAANIASVGNGNGMGTSWSDYNNDGWPDAYVTRIGKAGFFENNGDGTFTDIAASSGAEPNGMSWGTVFADFDLDGDEDLFVASTFGYDSTPSMLYRNHKGHFSEIGLAAGAQFELDSSGAASGDFNNDGLPDIFVTDSRGKSRLLINTTITSYNWIKVVLNSNVTNRHGVGATIMAYVGSTARSRYIMAGDSYNSQSSPTAMFGLKSSQRIDSLRVIWDSGSEDVLGEMEANQLVTVERGVSPTSVDPVFNRTSPLVSRNYPEPFSGETTIEIGITEDIAPGRSPARFDVFNVLGKIVFSRNVDLSISRSFTFDGSQLPVGIFHYRIATDRATSTGSMTIVR